VSLFLPGFQVWVLGCCLFSNPRRRFAPPGPPTAAPAPRSPDPQPAPPRAPFSNPPSPCSTPRSTPRCVTDIPDECAADNGGCWAGDFPVGGKQQRFSACRDNLPAYRDALARGQPAEALPPLHNCACPPCFIGVERRGKVACEPRCAPDLCDADAGVCHADPAGGGRLSAAQVAGVVVGVAAALAAAAAVAYKLHIRAQMESEVRSILAQYMPLGDQDGVEPGGAGRGLLPVGAPGSGLG
jgi:hypothetical protein